MSKTKKIKFTKGETNLATEYSIDLDALLSGERVHTVQNPFSGASVLLNNEELKLYGEVMEKYNQYERGNFNVVRAYDRLKYLFAKVNPSAYVDLID